MMAKIGTGSLVDKAVEALEAAESHASEQRRLDRAHQKAMRALVDRGTKADMRAYEKRRDEIVEKYNP